MVAKTISVVPDGGMQQVDVNKKKRAAAVVHAPDGISDEPKPPGSITMKETFDDENSEMNAALLIDGHLGAPEMQSPPHNEKEKDTTNDRCKCYHRCISHCGVDGCKISDGLCAGHWTLDTGHWT